MGNSRWFRARNHLYRTAIRLIAQAFRAGRKPHHVGDFADEFNREAVLPGRHFQSGLFAFHTNRPGSGAQDSLLSPHVALLNNLLLSIRWLLDNCRSIEPPRNHEAPDPLPERSPAHSSARASFIQIWAISSSNALPAESKVSCAKRRHCHARSRCSSAVNFEGDSNRLGPPDAFASWQNALAADWFQKMTRPWPKLVRSRPDRNYAHALIAGTNRGVPA
jgi:hypothetical protein